jgi:hypothetical protein
MDAAAGPAMQANFMRERVDALAGGLAVLIDELAHGVLVATIKGEVLHAVSTRDACKRWTPGRSAS